MANLELLHVDLVESFDGHAVEIAVPRFRISIDRRKWKGGRWNWFRDEHSHSVQYTFFTPLFLITIEDWKKANRKVARDG